MSDAVDYFRAYAKRAVCKARSMRPGRPKLLQRAVVRVYHWLSKEASFTPNSDRLDEFRIALEIEKSIDPVTQDQLTTRRTPNAPDLSMQARGHRPAS